MLYFSYLLGHEGENSLFSFLKAENLASGLTSYADHDLDSISNLSVEIDLTEKGYANHERVLAAVFAYAKMLVERGPQDYIFEEYHKVGKLKFNFLERGSEMSHCINTSQTMRLFGEEPKAL